MLFKVIADLMPALCSVPCTLARRGDDASTYVAEGRGYNCFITLRQDLSAISPSVLVQHLVHAQKY